MELDHTNLGHNCDVATCNQRDFLPFTCDLCRRKLCLLHRSYNAHSCEGSNSKDMTSIDCPICGKGVKFSQAQAVDEVWEHHYNNNCSREFSAAKAAKICFKNTCTTVLGLSNSFRCPKCAREVCLAHRVPEEHDCASLKGNKTANRPNGALLDRIEKQRYQNQEPKGNPVSTNYATNKTTGVKKNTTNDTNNSLKGSAERRMEGSYGTRVGADNGVHGNNNGTDSSSNNSNMGMEQFACPVCAFSTTNAVELQSHFTACHPDPSSFGPSSISPASASAREVCPLCSETFADPGSLVAHFERSHPTPSGNAGSRSGTGSASSGGIGSDCALS